MARPLYLHLLDRELGDSVGRRLSPEQIEAVVRVLALGTAVPLYAGLSLAWEHPSVDASLQSLLGVLIRHHQLDLVSSHPVLDEFLASRGPMYAHDRDRYGHYFAGGERPFEPTRYKPEGTTLTLHVELEEHLGKLGSTLLPDSAKPIVESVLDRREGAAITYALFAPAMGYAAPPFVGGLRRSISHLYTSHYLTFDGADLPTSVPGLNYFDAALAEDYPTSDFYVVRAVLRQVGFAREVDSRASDHPGFWEAAAASRMVETDLADRIRELVELASKVERASATPSLPTTARLVGRITRWIRSTAAPSAAPDDRFAAAALFLTATIEKLLGEHPELRGGGDGDVGTLVVVATDVEETMLKDVLRRRYGRSPDTRLMARTVARGMGGFPRGAASYVRCRMGGHSLRGASDVVRDAIDELKPREVVMVGIAFGVDEDRQPIGTVLISTQVIDYGSGRAGTSPKGLLELSSRAEPGDADDFLVRAFAALGERRPGRTERGPLLSDHVLVDNRDFRDELVRHFPKAIGGEMEGYGVYTAACGRYCPWVLVKAVCDWGDGNKAVDKEERQRLAASASVERLFDYLDAS
ncbi:MAG: hypothetical protein ACRDZW_07140 [Acidimicrobiales bacterium]